jgi:hypothetical protein
MKISAKHVLISLIAVIIMTGALTFIGSTAQKHTVKQMVEAADNIEQRYAFLYKKFGEIPHFYKSLEMAIIEKGYSVLELLLIGHKAVNEESIEHFKAITLPSLQQFIHLHATGFANHMAVTAGGYPITDVEVDKEGRFITVYENVSQATVTYLEQHIDGSVFTERGDETGRSSYKRHGSGYQVKIKGLSAYP